MHRFIPLISAALVAACPSPRPAEGEGDPGEGEGEVGEGEGDVAEGEGDVGEGEGDVGEEGEGDAGEGEGEGDAGCHDGGDGVCVAPGTCSEGFALQTDGTCNAWHTSAFEPPSSAGALSIAVVGDCVLAIGDDDRLLRRSQLVGQDIEFLGYVQDRFFSGPIIDLGDGDVLVFNEGPVTVDGIENNVTRYTVSRRCDIISPRPLTASTTSRETGFGTRLADGSVLIGGGFVAQETTSSLERASFSTDTGDLVWTNVGAMPGPKFSGAIAVTDETRVWIVGGRSDRGIFEARQSNLEEWTTLENLEGQTQCAAFETEVFCTGRDTSEVLFVDLNAPAARIRTLPSPSNIAPQMSIIVAPDFIFLAGGLGDVFRTAVADRAVLARAGGEQ